MRKVVVALLVVVVASAVASYWLLADANRFKDPLTDLLKKKTGLTFDFAGDLSWRLWPPVQLVARDVSADWDQKAPTPFIKVATVQLGVDLWPLLTGHSRLVVDGVTLTGLDAHLVKRGSTANWTPPGGTVSAPPVPIAVSGGKVESGANTWEVAVVSLRDSTLHYALDDDRYDATIKKLELANIAPGKTSPTHAVLTLTTAKGTFDIDARAEVTTSADGEQIDVRKGRIEAVAHPLELPVRAMFDAHYDLKQSTLDVAGAELALADVRAKLDLKGELADAAHWQGHLDLPLQKLGSLSMLISPPDEAVGISSSFSADADTVSLPDLEVAYGNSKVKGSASATLHPRPKLRFDLNASELRLASHTPQVAIGAGGFAAVAIAAPTVAASPATDLDDPLLPLATIRDFDWDGKLHLGRLVADRGTFANVGVTTSGEGGRMRASVTLPEFLGGRANADVDIDASSNEPAPRWTVKPALERVKSEELLEFLDEKYEWVALVMGGADLAMTGNTRRELATSLRGKTTFDGGQGKLDISKIREQALAIAQVAGHADRVAAWPQVLDYKRFTGTWIADGAQHRLDLLLDNLSLAMHGTVDPIGKTLDMAVAVTVLDKSPYPSFKVDPLLMGLAIPARCRGPLDKPDCKADKDGLKKMLGQALTGENPELRDRLDKAIDEKVPDQYKDAAHSLLDKLGKGGGKHHNKQQGGAGEPESPSPSDDTPPQ